MFQVFSASSLGVGIWIQEITEEDRQKLLQHCEVENGWYYPGVQAAGAYLLGIPMSWVLKGAFKWALGPISCLIALGKTSDEFFYINTQIPEAKTHMKRFRFLCANQFHLNMQVDLDTFSICICFDGPIDVGIYQKITTLPPGQGLQAHCDYPWY